MPVDVGAIFLRGGRDLINLLEYCVYSVQMDPLFLFLVNEYRLAPTTEKALALYELFCAADAPARISLLGELPPKDFRLPRALTPYFQTRQLLRERTAPANSPGTAQASEPTQPDQQDAAIRQDLERNGTSSETGGEAAADESMVRTQRKGGAQPTPAPLPGLPQNLMLLPPAHVFDFVRNALLARRPCPLKRLGKQFDPLLTARENLIGGELNASQKFFVDFVWTPRVRPQLVSAGFRRVANVA
jgi:hypothetical protein